MSRLNSYIVFEFLDIYLMILILNNATTDLKQLRTFTCKIYGKRIHTDFGPVVFFVSVVICPA